MSLTYTYGGKDQVKGPGQNGTALHIVRGTLNLSGTYATGGNQVDLCNFFTASREGVTAINVLWAKAFGDYNDGTNALDADNTAMALASGGSATAISAASTNNLATIKLFTGTNGSGGSEVTNGTALSGSVGVVFAVQLTYGSLGVQ